MDIQLFSAKKKPFYRSKNKILDLVLNLAQQMRLYLLLTFCLLCPFFYVGCQTPNIAPAVPFDPSAQNVALALEVEGGRLQNIPLEKLCTLEDLPELKHHDHLLGEERHFIGLGLSQLRELSGANSEHKVVKLHCRDGYVSEVEASILENGRFILAFRDINASPKAFLSFEDMVYLQTEPKAREKRLESGEIPDAEQPNYRSELEHLKTMAKDMKILGNQGPFYPIFLPGENQAQTENWSPPFCIDKVTFAKTKTDRSLSLPDGLSEEHPASRGATLFKQRCATCHMVNGIGGAVGPELNVPRSVTEYWEEPALRQMMKDPGLVRKNSKMPAFQLPESTIDDILAYLNWMASHKKNSSSYKGL